MSMELVFFFLFSVMALSGATGVVFLRDPVKGALSLVACFFSIACLYLLQSAELMAVLEVLVYAGAIMVLFVFVIMLVENHNEPILPRSMIRRIAAPMKVGAVVLVAANILVVVAKTEFGAGHQLGKGFGTSAAVGRVLYNQYAFQFELVSVLLLAAIVGAVMISRKDRDEKKEPPR
ncbi:MAG: NADH-quinone oxidoreductase subunit J [Myxococcota bacterium]